MSRRPILRCLLLAAFATAGAAAASDLSVTKMDSPDPVVPGGTITYTITVTNSGPGSAADVVLSDEIPADTRQVSFDSPPGWSCIAPTIGTVTCDNPSFDVGSAVFTMTVEASSAFTTGAVITNTASVTSSTFDPNPGNESATTTTTVAANTDAGAVSLTKSDFPDPVVAGTGLFYSLVARNASGGALGPTTVTDVLPAGTTFLTLNPPSAGWSCTAPPAETTGTVTCSTAVFAPGDSFLGFFVRVNPSVPAGTVLTNTADLVVMDGSLGVITRDATTTTTVITPGAIVYGTKAVSSGSLTPGSALTYTVVLTNNGDSPQGDNPGDEFTDVLPAGLTLVSATATSGTATANVATRTVTWNGSIASGASVTITINAVIDPAVPPGTTITNQGTIFYDTDVNGANEASTGTDNPATPNANPDPTSFVVSVAPPIPTVNEIGLMLLALLLAMGGAWTLRRRQGDAF